MNIYRVYDTNTDTWFDIAWDHVTKIERTEICGHMGMLPMILVTTNIEGVDRTIQFSEHTATVMQEPKQ